MKLGKTLKLATMASIAVLTLAACSDTTISSPGTSNPPASPPPPPPPPPAAATIDLVPTAGCPTGTTETSLVEITADGFADVDVCVLGSDAQGGTVITADLNIPADTTIAIQGPVFIGEDNKNGAGTAVTLTVGAGVRFFGASVDGAASGTDDYLVVSRGSKIEAVGTAAKPVRFTARAAINDEETGSNLIDLGTNAQWGGLVINGFAPINHCNLTTVSGGDADCEKSGEGSSGLFGGNVADDDSGTLNYVIVEYAGSRVTNTDELNGIAFQGVGSGTSVDYVQVHNNLDDGIEWFGGTVSAKHIVITGAGDDSLDWTDGWTGKLQFAAVRSLVPSSDDPRGIEADNRDKQNELTPFSSPSVSNFTLVGSDGNQQGILLRRGTKGTIVNGIVTGYATGIDVDDPQTFTNFDDGDLVIQSLLLDTAQNFATDSDGVPTFPASDNIRTGTNSLVENFFPGQQELSVPVSAALAGDSFFATTDYIGAFGPSESVSSNWASFALPGTLFDATAAECPTGTTENGTLDGKKLCEISGASEITSDLRLTDGDQLIYELLGKVSIGKDQGADPANPIAGSASATLTIDAGVTIVAAGVDDYIVIARGSRILSNGTASKPVVFTAKDVVNGTTTNLDQDTKGLWGGLVINGRGPINDCNDTTATGGTVGCQKIGEGDSGFFGGATADDDSGQLFYTRVQYAGTRVTNTDELNGIAFQGVGSGTEVDYVQVYNNLDDCFEFFGGAVNAKHLVATGCGDDSFDWTDGWIGSLQYGIVYGGAGSVSDDPRGIEGDNRDKDNTKTPFSTPRLSNFTVISSGDANADTGVLLRRGMKGTIVNGIVIGWPDAGLDVDDADTKAFFDNGDLVIGSLFLSGNGEAVESGDGADDVTFTAADNVVENGTSTMSGFTFRAGRPGVVPGANENAVTVYDVTGIGQLEPTTYIGAVKDADDKWFLGWTINQEGQLTSAN
ncbi:MAG: hypothetical protein GYB49_09210 [Alphaproteobacteria bacterium]|nr:hypothetical protein [Hyphomonas sp.]MBR9807387.1 hypothetical protein [Alphaproteobacteria bacterium]|tara:strand:+ start:14059 stop:16935 length:2877 start_codon:yes stop_codon:yes gene_type:complete